MEPLYRFEARLGEPVVIGPVADGLRVDWPFEGEIVSGIWKGARVRGIDYLRVRPDGVGLIDAREAFYLPEGVIHARAQGYIVPPEGIRAATPEEIVAAGYAPGDVWNEIRGFALCEAGAPALAEAARPVCSIEGRVNPGTGGLVIEGRVLPRREVALPGTAVRAAA